MTGRLEYIEGFPIHSPNDVYQGTADFYISYNDRDTDLYGSDTTAIVTGQMEHFYVLNGNHVDAYKGKSLDECFDYFRANAPLRNKYSEKLSA